MDVQYASKGDSDQCMNYDLASKVVSIQHLTLSTLVSLFVSGLEQGKLLVDIPHGKFSSLIVTVYRLTYEFYLARTRC